MKAILVVANKTLGGRNLADYLEGRCRNGPLVIHLLVPLEHLPVWCAGDPFMADTTWLDPAWEDTRDNAREALRAEASDRAESLQDWLQHIGASTTTQLCDSEPLSAIAHAVTTSVYDEIVISTLPKGLSRWLHLDLPHRVERRFPLPITTVIDDLRQRKQTKAVHSTH